MPERQLAIYRFVRRGLLCWAVLLAALSASCGGGGPDATEAGRGVSSSSVDEPVVITGAPSVLYTDALTGPTSGGEFNAGAYLSIFGKNFGPASNLGVATKVYIGGVEVANYRYLGPAVSDTATKKLGIQQIVVQVGALGGAAKGVALPVKVVVDGVESNTNQTFTPSAGRMLFVALNGNDAKAVAGDIANPWRYLQNMASMTGAYFAAAAGDHIVLRAGNWSDVNGLNGTWMQAGRLDAARNGTASAWIHVTAYPGPIKGNAIEKVQYTTPANAAGGFAGPESESVKLGRTGEYWSFSNLHMSVSGGAARDAAPINFQYGGGPWRVVNNEFGPWVAGNSPVLNAAAVSGHGDGHQILGNHIHDIQGTSELQNHGIYADSMSQNWEIAFNWIHDISGGSLVQFNDNSGCAGEPLATSMCGALPRTGGVWPGFVGMRVHHNWLENAAKYGINYNDQFVTKQGRYEGLHWNNVIIGTTHAPIRISSTQPVQRLWFAFNTVYDCLSGDYSAYAAGAGYVRNDQGFGVSASGANQVQNVFYNNLFALGPHTTGTAGWFADNASAGLDATASSYDFKRNLYFANGRSAAAPALIGDTLSVQGDPKFVNAATHQLALQADSAAIDQGTQALPGGLRVLDDLGLLVSRPQGAAPDVGAYEFQP